VKERVIDDERRNATDEVEVIGSRKRKMSGGIVLT